MLAIAWIALIESDTNRNLEWGSDDESESTRRLWKKAVSQITGAPLPPSLEPSLEAPYLRPLLPALDATMSMSDVPTLCVTSPESLATPPPGGASSKSVTKTNTSPSSEYPAETLISMDSATEEDLMKPKGLIEKLTDFA
ncbi:hypothetical protein M8J77_013416 [Diaphorina citri]|nr:hypothetical protein M8J77_013416 [Diaphorina citri]